MQISESSLLAGDPAGYTAKASFYFDSHSKVSMQSIFFFFKYLF